jgi:hypothetical protein
LPNNVSALASFDEDGPGPLPVRLFAGGNLTYVMRWDGTEWSTVGAPFDGGVWALAVFDIDGTGPGLPALFAGGTFTAIGGVQAWSLARWDGREWHGLGAGVPGAVWALAVHDSDGSGPEPPGLYCGGRFATAGGVGTNAIARWGCPLTPVCYANCDGSADPVLTIEDFGCFHTRFVAGDPYADCSVDGVLTVADFGCFQTKFVAGCP